MFPDLRKSVRCSLHAAHIMRPRHGTLLVIAWACALAWIPVHPASASWSSSASPLLNRLGLQQKQAGQQQHNQGLQHHLRFPDSSASSSQQHAGAGSSRHLHASSVDGVRPKIYMYNVSAAFRDNPESHVWINTSLYGLEIVRSCRSKTVCDTAVMHGPMAAPPLVVVQACPTCA